MRSLAVAAVGVMVSLTGVSCAGASAAKGSEWKEPTAAELRAADRPALVPRAALGDSEAMELLALDEAITRHQEVHVPPVHVRMSVTPISGTLVSSTVEGERGGPVKQRLVHERTCFDVFLSARSESNAKVEEGQLSAWAFSAEVGGNHLELQTISSLRGEAAELRARLTEQLKAGHKDRARDISGPGRYMREFVCGPASDLTRLSRFEAVLRTKPAAKVVLDWTVAAPRAE